jgi:hypothetical protein
VPANTEVMEWCYIYISILLDLSKLYKKCACSLNTFTGQVYVKVDYLGFWDLAL